MSSPTSALTVILTHEHTDFDALGSMLAAARLFPRAVPVLPRVINRNLQAFLAEFSDMLPFVRQEDLAKRRIDQVILVDTQSVQPVRGMGPQTAVRIIDHHPPRDLPANWVYSGDETGATTTLLLEQIIAKGLIVSPLEATLLLLGIYEDTGSLTYGTTDARDLRAAAWLLEQGGNLGVVDRFLHHPLTEEQLQLYQQLADNSQPYQFSGHTVIIASATVERPVDEISTLTHKLQDLYEPDALFLLVQLGRQPADAIQLVARSTSDDIDVGKISAAFGGGGHGRAAAGLIRDRSLASVFESLVYQLQSAIQPSVTVGQIMSYGAPQTLRSDDTMAAAAERTRRYGFEGFPVVEDGRIVGMITRREIDRALHHGLERHPVSRYMRAGEIYVTPEDSVATLRKVMTENDWGQVPVVDRRTGGLLGIVTRTDLIKQWATPSATAPESLAGLMEEALPGALLDLLKRAGGVAHELGFPVFAVGGFVRDLLLNEPNFDVDLVVEGDAIRLTQELVAQLGGRMRSHRRFGTAKWILPDSMLEKQDGQPDPGLPAALDFVTARTEFYEHPTALPTVERSSVKQDLHRRDFTINTLAVRLTPERWGLLLDFYGGRRDLEEGIIRVLHSLSFVEDPTRILRAARFEQRFGFRIEARTEELISDALDLLDRVSAERVRHELELILAEAQPERAVCRLAGLGVLAKMHSALRCDTWFTAKAVELRSAFEAVMARRGQDLAGLIISAESLPRFYLSLLLYTAPMGEVEDFMERFRIRTEYRDLVREVRGLASRLETLQRGDLRPSELVSVLDESSDEARFVLRVACDDWIVRQRLDQYQRRLRHIVPELSGDDLKRLGLPPGRIYRQILLRLRAARLDGEINTRAEEVKVATSELGQQ